MRLVERTPGPGATPMPPAPGRGRHAPLSLALWGLDWCRHLPIELPGGVTVRPSSYDAALPFIREHYARIFEEDVASPFSSSGLSDVKQRYYRVAGDFFELERAGRTVGLMVCTCSDWSTYYIRSAALLPECRGRKTIEHLIGFLLPTLRRAGVERVEADIAPQNLATATLLRNLGFHSGGTLLTDRWGAHARLVRYLDERREDVFLRQFCAGAKPRRAGSSGSGEPPGPERTSP